MNEVYWLWTDITRSKLINHIYIFESQIDYNIIHNLDQTLSKINFWKKKVWRPEIQPDPK
jgi:hypothetical protein